MITASMARSGSLPLLRSSNIWELWRIRSTVATEVGVNQFHRDHRGPVNHPAISEQFSAQADSAKSAQGR
ncbi:hypothetical protein, partial [Hyalangium versicolor]|uniref:hypothetical protein n=1 Tax=Hyalangium versicolor TaxID=2861190 RepID=UPI001CCC0E94